MKHSKRMDGVTLVEVLVTVMVISVGLLGVVALQAITVRDNYSSFLRGQATALADDIIDRIRANRDNAAAYNVSLTGTVSGTTVAALDVTGWKTQLRTMLPKSGSATPVDANGSITVTPLAAGRFSVEVRIAWGERDGSSAGASAIQFVTRTEV
jgi:type IV pilus assembly protein PilV